MPPRTGVRSRTSRWPDVARVVDHAGAIAELGKIESSIAARIHNGRQGQTTQSRFEPGVAGSPIIEIVGVPLTAQACVELSLQLKHGVNFRAPSGHSHGSETAPRSVAAHAHHAYALGQLWI